MLSVNFCVLNCLQTILDILKLTIGLGFFTGIKTRSLEGTDVFSSGWPKVVFVLTIIM